MSSKAIASRLYSSISFSKRGSILIVKLRMRLEREASAPVIPAAS